MNLFEIKKKHKSVVSARMDVVHVWSSAHWWLAEALVEADQSAENLLAVRVQLLQLFLYQGCVLR